MKIKPMNSRFKCMVTSAGWVTKTTLLLHFNTEAKDNL